MKILTYALFGFSLIAAIIAYAVPFKTADGWANPYCPPLYGEEFCSQAQHYDDEWDGPYRAFQRLGGHWVTDLCIGGYDRTQYRREADAQADVRYGWLNSIGILLAILWVLFVLIHRLRFTETILTLILLAVIVIGAFTLTGPSAGRCHYVHFEIENIQYNLAAPILILLSVCSGIAAIVLKHSSIPRQSHAPDSVM